MFLCYKYILSTLISISEEENSDQGSTDDHHVLHSDIMFTEKTIFLPILSFLHQFFPIILKYGVAHNTIIHIS